MTRTKRILLIILAVLLILACSGTAVVLVVRSYFTITDSETIPATVAPIEEVSESQPKLTLASGGDATVVPPTSLIPATPEAVVAIPTTTSPTAVSVRSTSVKYAQARTAVNIRSGPGTGYNVVSWLETGQTVVVTGVSDDSEWWRVVCPNGNGDCWVTALAQYTQPVDAPASPPTANPTATPTSQPAACTYAATLVGHMTMPDGSELPTDVEFAKMWRIQNNGTCAWDGRIFLVHASGPLLGAAFAQVAIPGTVPPGETVDLTVPMRSPVTPGTYQSDWQLEAPDGARFGLFSIRLVVFATPTLDGAIGGLVFTDENGNGLYDGGEIVANGRTVQLLEGNQCQPGDTVVDGVAIDANGRYQFNGRFAGEYCVVLLGAAGLEATAPLSVTSGQVVDNINLIVP